MTEFEIAKGVKDWYGPDAIIRNKIRVALRGVFERYGYNPIETPIIERVETLGFKGGGEIQKEVFRLTDQGERHLGLRFDQTVPLGRFIASHPDIKLPFKRYVIGEVFRDGPTQPEQGRYRIFTQCDVDVVGIKEMAAEAELLALAEDAFAALGLGDAEVRINNRKLLDGLLEYAGVPAPARTQTIVVLDKADKIGMDGVERELVELREFDSDAELSTSTLRSIIESYAQSGIQGIRSLRPAIVADVGEAGYDAFIEECETAGSDAGVRAVVGEFRTRGKKLLVQENITALLDVVRTGGSNEEIYSRLGKIIASPKGCEGLGEIRQLLDYSKSLGLGCVQFDPCLARGLDYYTGTTIEVYLKDKQKIKSAILAGGRYDNMIGEFAGVPELPAVGFSFGLERLAMVLKDSMSASTMAQLYIIPVGDVMPACLAIARAFRAKGVNVDMEFQKKKVGQSISYAEQAGMPFIALIGKDELAKGVVTLKQLATRQQSALSLDEAVERIRR